MRILFILVVALLSGCAAAPKGPSDEQRMEITGNYPGLQQLYRQRIQDNPKDDLAKVKLAKVYAQSGDQEAALYYLESIPDGRCNAIEGCWLQKAQLAYDAGDYVGASQHIERSLVAGQDYYPAQNLRAIILANQGHFSKARETLYQARLGMDQENVVINNLAMLDMMEGQYAHAAQRLMPLYTKGHSDVTIRANLFIALMRSHQHTVVKSLLLQEFDQPTALRIYAQLKNDLSADSVSGTAFYTSEETS
ncbi:tetratricopeptide repeat protein [Vibrio navarrensis]